MFYWKEAGKVSFAKGYEGKICTTSNRKPSLSFFRETDNNYYTWFWKSEVIPEKFIGEINRFIDSSKPSFPHDVATIVFTNLDDRSHAHKRVRMPLEVIDGTFNGIELATLTSFRIDVPGPNTAPAPTILGGGDSATVRGFGPRGVSFLLMCEDEVQLAATASFTPAESIAELYVQTIGQKISKAERASLVAAIAERVRRAN